MTPTATSEEWTDQERTERDTVRRTFSLAEAVPVAAEREPRDSGGGRSLPHIAVGAHVSSLGVGPSVAIPVTDVFVVNVSGNYFEYEENDTFGDTRYDVDLQLLTVGGTVDWHPFGNPLFVSGGVFWNQNEAEFDVTPIVPLQIGNVFYTPLQLGRVKGDIEFNEIAPYVGFGVDTTHHGDFPISVYASLGVLYQGEPDVDLSVSGPATNLPGFQSNLQREVDDIEDDLRDILEFYPVATFGVRIRF